jgi:hypothetical protein
VKTGTSEVIWEHEHGTVETQAPLTIALLVKQLWLESQRTAKVGCRWEIANRLKRARFTRGGPGMFDVACQHVTDRNVRIDWTVIVGVITNGNPYVVCGLWHFSAPCAPLCRVRLVGGSHLYKFSVLRVW